MSAHPGRYTRLDGSAWRSKKVRSVSMAARGLLLDIWSFVADRASRGAMSRADMQLVRGGNKNSSRYVSELCEAGLIERTADGFRVHEWADWNPKSGTRKESGADKNAVDNAVDNAETHYSINTGRYGPSLKTQDQGPRISSLRSEGEGRAREPSGRTLAEQMRVQFVAAWEKQHAASPSMGGRNLGDFAERVARTAELRREQPIEVFEKSLAAWLKQPKSDVERRAPYACFAAAFESALPTQRKPHVDSVKAYGF